MKKLIFSFWTQLAARLLLGAVLIYAGGLKIMTPGAFADSVASFQIVPYALVNLLAITLPILEIFIGLLLIVGFSTRVAALSSGMLLIFFSLGIIQAWARGIPIDCGCFGKGTETGVLGNLISVLRNTGLFGCAFFIYALEIINRKQFMNKGAFQLDSPSEPAMNVHANRV